MLNGLEFPLIGNVTRDPEVKFSSAGKAWCTFSIAVNRVTNNRDGERSEKATFVNCKAFGDMAENIGATLKKGNRVIAYGRMEEESWKDKEGQDRKSMAFIVDEIGPSLRWATAEVSRTASNGNGGGGNGGGYQRGGNGGGGYQGGGNGGGGNYSAPEPAGAPAGGDDNPFF